MCLLRGNRRIDLFFLPCFLVSLGWLSEACVYARYRNMKISVFLPLLMWNCAAKVSMR